MKVFGRVIRTRSDPAQGVARRRAQYRDGHEPRITRIDPYETLSEREREILTHIASGGSHYFGNVTRALGLGIGSIDSVGQTMRSMVYRLTGGKRRGASTDNLRYIARMAKSKGLI